MPATIKISDPPLNILLPQSGEINQPAASARRVLQKKREKKDGFFCPAHLCLWREQRNDYSCITREIAGEHAAYLWSSQSRKISSNTFNYHIQSLKLIARILTGKAGLDFNPWDRITRKTEIKQRRRAFSAEQMSKIFAAFSDENLRLMHKEETEILFNIGAYTGLRLADAVQLKWEHVSLEQGVISVTPVKTRKIQRRVNIPLHSRLRALLECARNWCDDSGFVLPKTAARYSYNPDGVNSDCIAVLDFCGLTERGEGRGRSRRLYGFHSFRHFFATTCANAGVPVSTLAEILGDNITTLNKYYVHAEESHRVKVLAALESGTPTAGEHENNSEPERAELSGLAGTADITAVRKALTILRDAGKAKLLRE